MSRWFRFYDDAINDPKVQRLAGDTFKAWVNILCLASKNEGVLPCLSDIAFALRLDEIQASDLLNQFYKLQLLDEVEVPDAPMSYTPHNWNGRQYKSDVTDPTAATRQQRYRNNRRNADRNATVTNTATRTDTEQKQKEEHCPVAKATRTAVTYSEEFETSFWKPFPRTAIMSKKEAWREWMKLAPDQRLAACRAIEPYKIHLKKTPTLQAVHACRFLSQDRAEGILEIAAERPAFDIRGSFV